MGACIPLRAQGVVVGAGDAAFQALGQGWIAGGAAAEAADDLDIPEVNMDEVNAVIDHCLELLEREETDGALRATAVLESIREASWNLQYSRNEEGCQAAIDEYARIRADELPKMYCADKSRITNNEWKSAIEAENAIMCGEAIALASSMRKETRPWFYRSDYPKIDKEPYYAEYEVPIVDEEEVHTVLKCLHYIRAGRLMHHLRGSCSSAGLQAQLGFRKKLDMLPEAYYSHVQGMYNVGVQGGCHG